MKIALVLNRFYPEVGGAETNLYFQAKELSKRHNVTVFTPRRLPETPKKETIGSFTVHRLLDIRNRLPNIGRDTFMPGIFFRILFGSFDAVMAFPALNHNNMLALIAARIRRVPFILCSFDLLDYAEIQKKTGTIDPHCLEHFTPSRTRQYLFRKCSHIFAISNREMDVFRRYNPHVSFSPVPVETSEYEADIDRAAFRKRYGIAEDAMVFLVLGRVSRIKGQDIAVKAFIEAAPRMPGSILAVVGRSDYEPDFLEGMKSAIREAKLDDGEGADIIMVKPALAYLDVIAKVRECTDKPIAAYCVSGEYTMLKNAVDAGLMREEVIYESHIAIKRAGSDVILTYFAKDLARFIEEA